MRHRDLQHIPSTLWDILLAFFPVALVQLWPDIFTQWMSLAGVPLLMVRYQLVALSRPRAVRSALRAPGA